MLAASSPKQSPCAPSEPVFGEASFGSAYNAKAGLELLPSPPQKLSFKRQARMFNSASGNEELIQVKEAVRKKIQSENYIGARALVEETRTQQLLKDRTPGMLLVCDLFCARSIDVPSYGTDWYWVLQVPPSVDTATIESQHSKLTAVLEELVKEEELRFIAETALRLVGDAYAILVDGERRSVFDQRRSNTWKQFYDLVSASKHVDLVGNRGETQAAVEASSAGSLLTSLGMKRHSNVEVGTVIEGLGPVALEKEASAARKGKRICTEDDRIHPTLSEGGKSVPDYELENHRASHSSEEIGCSSTSYADDIPDSKSSNPTSTRWSYKDFQPDQVWAVYGNGTGTMPRSYVKVVGVSSFHHVKVTFLEINPMLEAEIRWVEDNLPFACGVFRAGTKTTSLDITRFSHPVDCDRSNKKTFFRVFPKKGEVWAMYKDWSNKWTAADYVKAECYVVEILSDYSMDNCISTCSLVEVDGYMTFFRRRLFEGSMLFKKFLRMDFLCFSHRIPAYNVVGIEDPSIPNEAWHLEPDALPPKYEDGSSANLCNPVANQIPVT